MVESPEEESQEREAKRLKATGAAAGEHGNYVDESFDAYLAAASPGYLRKRALDHYYKHESSYLNHDISAQDFMFCAGTPSRNATRPWQQPRKLGQTAVLRRRGGRS